VKPETRLIFPPVRLVSLFQGSRPTKPILLISLHPTESPVKNQFATIVLAAGLSSRMNDWKPGLPWKGEPLILHAIRPALAESGQVILVGGHHLDDLRRLVEGGGWITEDGRNSLSVVENKEYSTGMFSSVQAGIRGLQGKVDGVFILPGDMPSIRATTYSELVAAFEARLNDEVFSPALTLPSGESSREPRIKKGHPVLLRNRILKQVLAHDPRSVLRDVLRRFSSTLVVVEDPGIVVDVDVAGDFRRLESSQRKD